MIGGPRSPGGPPPSPPLSPCSLPTPPLPHLPQRNLQRVLCPPLSWESREREKGDGEEKVNLRSLEGEWEGKGQWNEKKWKEEKYKLSRNTLLKNAIEKAFRVFSLICLKIWTDKRKEGLALLSIYYWVTRQEEIPGRLWDSGIDNIIQHSKSH